MEKAELMLCVREVNDEKADIHMKTRGDTRTIANYYVRVSTELLNDFSKIDADAPRIILNVLAEEFGFKLVEK